MTQNSESVIRAVALAHSFVKSVACVATMAIVLMSSYGATAEPVRLKLSFFASEKTDIYKAAIKPFVDGVNAEGAGLIAIDVYPNGMLGKAVAEQPGLVLDGPADIAWVIPGQTPYRFPDNQLLELPGLFRDGREGTLTYTRLVAAAALRGYQDFVVIGAFTSGPTFIHSRKPIGSLAAIHGQKIRANNSIEADVLERLGATPTVMPASQIANAISHGSIDGAALSPTALFDFRVAPVAKNHYILRGGVSPLLLVMNRKKFDSLPEAAQVLVRKYSGERSAAAWIAIFNAGEQTSLDKLKADPGHKVVEPSPADLKAAQRIYRSMIDAWAAKSAKNRDLLKKIDAELVTVRSATR